MITHNDGSIEIEAEDIHIPESEVDNWRIAIIVYKSSSMKSMMKSGRIMNF